MCDECVSTELAEVVALRRRCAELERIAEAEARDAADESASAMAELLVQAEAENARLRAELEQRRCGPGVRPF